MSDNHLAQWLFEHGGPVIRYRIAKEFPSAFKSVDIEALEYDLQGDATIRKWLDNLQSFEFMSEQRRLGKGLGQGGHSSFLHGPTNMNFEVVVPKLAQLGLHAGMPVLDEKVSPWLNFLENLLRQNYNDVYSDDRKFHFIVYAYHDGRLVVASCLALAGYINNESVQSVIRSRLDVIYEVVKKGSYDIYEKPGRLNIRPKKWAEHQLKFELYSEGNIKLPFVHDVCAYVALYKYSKQDVQQKIDTIVEWILQPEHQRLLENYGFIRYPSGRGKTVGLKLDLPGYSGFDKPDLKHGTIVLRCWQMAHFPEARKHKWFRSALKHLEGFKTNRETYLFPADYLEEVGERGRWTFGMRMGLGENRRNSMWRELESTFWMLAIRIAASDIDK